MIAYIVKRTFLAVFTILMISFISFWIITLPPGDYVDWYQRHLSTWGGDGGLSENSRTLTPEYIEYLREKFWLDRPFVFQYWKWITDIVVRGDFGETFRTEHGSNREVIADRLPYTIYLSIFTIVVTWLLSIPIGVYSAVRKNSLGDYVFTFLGFTGLAVPDFLLGLVMMYVFFAYFGHSVGGAFSGDYLTAPWSLGRVMDMLQHLIIPGVVLGTSGTAGLIRVMRNNLLDELSKPYVVTAQAKGLASWRLTLKYPVRVAINPFISGIGSMLPGLVSGSVIVSVVLSLPTLGPILLEAILSEDIYLSGVIILMMGILTVTGTLISDLMLVVVDPRIKLTGSARSGGGSV